MYEDVLVAYDGEEMDVVYEEQAPWKHHHLINATDLDPAVLAPAGSTALTSEHAGAVIDSSCAPCTAPDIAQASQLDPTQQAFFDEVVEWARSHATALGRDAAPAPLRLLCLGTAGAGKSWAVRLAVQAAREILGPRTVMVCAHTTGWIFPVAAVVINGRLAFTSWHQDSYRCELPWHICNVDFHSDLSWGRACRSSCFQHAV